MNERDLLNLEFLLAVDEKGLKKWMDQADLDDLLYAEELLQQVVLSDIDELADRSDLSIAKNYLKKFMN